MMQKVFYIPTSMSSIEWFIETAVSHNFSEKGLQALRLYINTLSMVEVDLSNCKKISFNRNLDKFIEVFQLNDAQYIVLK